MSVKKKTQKAKPKKTANNPKKKAVKKTATKKAITKKTKAIFVAHLIGFPADIKKIKSVINNKHI